MKSTFNNIFSNFSFDQLCLYADHVESCFQKANNFLEKEVKKIQQSVKDSVAKVGELELKKKEKEEAVSRLSTDIRHKQEEIQNLSERIRDKQRELRYTLSIPYS